MTKVLLEIELESFIVALEMRGLFLFGECEKCEKAVNWQDEVNICSYECTFCKSCSEEMRHQCPNSGGDLVPRPKRR